MSGRVQSVGFRAFVARQAVSLGIVGKVRNLFDGRVEILAAGSSGPMAVFHEAIERGPSHSQVQGCLVKDIEGDVIPLDTSSDFSISEDSEKTWL